MPMSMAQSNFDRFWRLAQYAYRAEAMRTQSDGHLGTSNALQTALQDAISFDHETCALLVTTRREGIAPHMSKTDDPYYRGYLWGCDKAINIMRGGE